MTVIDPLPPGSASIRPYSCMVVVTSEGGVMIPPLAGHDWRRLSFPELELLGRLTGHSGSVTELVRGVARSTGAAEGTLATFVAELESRGIPLVGDPLITPAARPSVSRAGGTGEPGPATELLLAATPVVLAPVTDGFEIVDHDGRIVERLSAAELDLLGHFGRPATVANALTAHRSSAGALALRAEEVEKLAGRLYASGLLRLVPPDDINRRNVRDEEQYRRWIRLKQEFIRVADRRREEHERTRPADAGGVRRVPVVPVEPQVGVPPLALGMLLAYARAHDGGALEKDFDFFPDWSAAEREPAAFAREPGVFLFSNYLWSHARNLALSSEIKRRHPGSVTIFGGPDTPKYERDTEAFFRSNPHVDVAVRGEGEVTTAEILGALRGLIGNGSVDLSALSEVRGLTFRAGERLVRTPDRDRVADLDAIPSPYLTGVFDAYGEVGGAMAIIETNRGCPYRCTFCDWGSATLSKIRQFDLERVFAELEWCAVRGFSGIFVADANFGIFPRDVEIAAWVAELKARHGYPRSFHTNYAKNSVKHLRRIVETMSGAGILTEGLLSLQSMDESTLATIQRSNIKVERYDELAREFRSAGLPLFVDLMVGLPGSTTSSFLKDLQECVDREVNVKIHLTELLVNSPMNEPGYREEHAIEVASADDRNSLVFPTLVDRESHRKLVVASATFTRDDYAEMLEMRRIFRPNENFGVLRYVSRYVRQETGLPEVELYDCLRRAAYDEPRRWPILALTWRAVPSFMVPPISWSLFIDEVRTYLVDELGVVPDGALETALAVQRAVLPAPRRRLPETLELPHDFTSWYRQVLAAKETEYRGDWATIAPPLRAFGPATFTVEDPHGVCAFGLGFESETDAYADWELVSPVARALAGRHRELALVEG
jgi:radical SAM superfamily enzyme YgiQ (UPF0313 family)